MYTLQCYIDVFNKLISSVVYDVDGHKLCWANYSGIIPEYMC